MNNDQLRQSLIDSISTTDKFKIKPYIIGLLFIGFVGFIFGIIIKDTQGTFQSFLINFVFWTGISQGALILSVVLRLTNAKWGRPIMRLSESAVAFLPVSLILYIVVIFGGGDLFVWIKEQAGHKAFWLSSPFLFIRVGFYLVLMTALSWIYVKNSIRSDVGILLDGKTIPDKFKNMLKDWNGAEKEIERINLKQNKLAVAIALCYAGCYSMFAIDLVMSLDPEWTSTLFGAYYFIGCFYAGIALTIVMASYFIDKPEAKIISTKQFHDLGKLLFGFAIVNGDFFYSQFLVIWYANLPEETHYIIGRTQHQPWQTIAYLVLLLMFVLPFVVLINKKIKTIPKAMRIISLSILMGLWLERTLLIAPAVAGNKSFPVGWIEISLTAGFLGLFILCIQYFWSRYPMISYSDPLLKYSIEEQK
jgi:hypothetical protein